MGARLLNVGSGFPLKKKTYRGKAECRKLFCDNTSLKEEISQLIKTNRRPGTVISKVALGKG